MSPSTDTASPTEDRAASRGRVGALRDIEHEVGVLMRRARRALAERAHQVHPDLQPAGYLVLAQVLQDGPVRGSGLCEVLQLDKGAVSRSVQHLLDLGLLDRTPDPDDGRATLVSVSEDGRRRFAAVDVERRAALDERFAGWKVSDLREVVDAMQRYNRTFA